MYTQLLVHIEELEIVLLLFCKYAKIVLLDLQAIPVLYNLFIQDPGDQPGILENGDDTKLLLCYSIPISITLYSANYEIETRIRLLTP